MSSRTFVIAEAGVNHNGSLELALRLVDAAHEAGADAVKFQTFRADRLAAKGAAKAAYQERTTGTEESQHAMLRKLELPDDAYVEIARRAASLGIEFLSTPYDIRSLQMLQKLGIRRVKLGSGEVTNAPLLRAAARTGLPVLLSTGMSTLGEVEAALAVLSAGMHDAEVAPLDALTSARGQSLLEQRVTLLHCTTEYPAPLDETNLRAIEAMRLAFQVPVGYSDHTEGTAVPIGAVALGATVIEKHFTLDRTMPGPDHKASVEQDELAALVRGIRAVERALGRPLKRPSATERQNALVARRSLVAAVSIRRGEVLTADKLDAKRPGNGVSPMRIAEIIGRRATRDYAPDDQIEI